MNITTKRFCAASAALTIWIALVWFTAWDFPPSQWRPEGRLVAAIVGIFLFASGLSYPFKEPHP